MRYRSFFMVMVSIWGWFASGSQPVFARVLPTFADIAERAKLSVVNIRTDQSLNPVRPRLDPYQFFLNETVQRQTESQSRGSGVIISESGDILTNYHVIAGATSIKVFFANKKTSVDASVVGTDPKTDLALLRVKLPGGIPIADLGNSDQLRVGDWVLAIGNPFGYEYTVTSGIISAKGRVIGMGPYDHFLQTDAPIHPGNSGGPLIDMRGRVIGINAAIDSEAFGIGFATPINLAKIVIKDLRTRGVVVRPWLGIVVKNSLNSAEISNAASTAANAGLVITNLVIESPAHRAGLKMGDLLLGIDQQRLPDQLALQRILLKQKPESTIKLKVYRAGQGYVTIPVVLGTTPKAKDLPAEKDLY